MKKLLLFFTKPLVGGALALIGTLEILFSIPFKYFTYQIPIWINALCVCIILLLAYAWKRIKIFYYIRTYTSGSFGCSYTYEWRWVKCSDQFNIYGYIPIDIGAKKVPVVNPNVPTIDCVHHYIEDTGKMQRYIMLSLYNKVESTKATNLIMHQVHTIESRR